MSANEAPQAPTRKKPWISMILVMALVAGIGVVVGLVLTKNKATYPKKWDERIAPLAAIAAKDRGLEFKHPVFVEFMSNKDFNKQVTTKDDDLSSEDKQSLAQQEGMLRALGLIGGKVDLLKQSNQLNSSGILAFYAPSDKKIRIRGTKLTPAIKVTLVHELTHVLQDQYFNIDKTQEKLDNNDTEDGWAYNALVEGDARRIETEYRDSLPKSVQAQLDKDDAAQRTSIGKDIKDVPDFLIADQQAPYDLGEVAVTRAARKGNGAVDDLFKTPPIHEIQLMQPWLLGKEWSTQTFTMPTLPKGAKKIDASEFGAYYLYMVLAEKLPLSKALAIADEWGGDSVLRYTQNKRTCASISFTGSTNPGTTKIYDGLRTWAASMKGAAKVTRSSSTVMVVTCDPGKTFTAAKDQSINAEQWLVARNSIESETEDGTELPFAICFANGALDRLGEGVLAETELTDAQQVQLTKVAQGCRAKE